MSAFKNFFHFTKRQRNALLTLSVIVVTLQVFLYFDDLLYPQKEFTAREVESFKKWVAEDSIQRYKATLLPPPFGFNPNEASDSIFKALGLRSSIRRSLLNYRNKGGRFYAYKDLEKIYGMDSNWVNHIKGYSEFPPRSSTKRDYDLNKYAKPQLKPFDPNLITLEEAKEKGLAEWRVKRMITYREKVKPFKTKQSLYKVYGFDSAFVKELLPYVEIDTTVIQKRETAKKPLVKVSLAMADSATLTQVRGIGGWSAKRIVAYREKLGGFVDKKQLLEVYGVTPERYKTFEKQLTLGSDSVVQININTATFKELLAHPYLEYEMVKALVYFRENTRPFKNVDELINMEGFTAEKLKKLKPYLKV